MTFTKHALPLAMACLVATAGMASAQSARFADIDRDGNGSLSYGELVTSFGRAGADRVWSRGDGDALSRGDIRALSARAGDDDDDDGRGVRGYRGGGDDDGRQGAGGGRDDGGGRGVVGGRDDDDDDGGRGAGGGRDDDDGRGGDDGGNDDDD